MALDLRPRGPEIPSFDIANIANLNEEALRHAELQAFNNSAHQFAIRLVEQMREFEQDLDAEHEVAIRVVAFGQAFELHVADIGYIDPSLVVFYGHSGRGEPVELVQHVSQISFLLMRAKRLEPEAPRRTIGFIEPEAGDVP